MTPENTQTIKFFKDTLNGEHYCLKSIPWQEHPLDKSGRMITMRGPAGHFMTIAQTKFTNGYQYWLMVSEPPVWFHSQALEQVRHTELSPDDLSNWLLRFDPGDLVFGADAYARPDHVSQGEFFTEVRL